MAKDRLITPSYCFILAANFLLYFGFWLLIPVLPFYLSEFFQAGNSTIGIVLSCYTVAALCIRPFSGYLLDTFARKPLYLFAYFIFMMMFGGYLIAGSLTLFIIFRIIHGVSFGMVTVGGSNWVPRVIDGDNNNYQVSNFFVEDGSYMRLKVLQIGYSLPGQMLQRVGVKGLRFFVQGENLFTITNYSGYDPEVGTRDGFDGGTYPQARTYTIGANITF